MVRWFRFRTISLVFLLLCWFIEAGFGQDRSITALHVVSLDSTKIAWITLTEKLEVVVAFKEPIDEMHSAMWNKARDIDAALKMIGLLQKSHIQALEISGKDAMSIGGNQRCKVRCEILGFRFSPESRD
jgi:hypothetical protein